MPGDRREPGTGIQPWLPFCLTVSKGVYGEKWNLPRIDSKSAVIALTVLALLYFIVLPLAVLIWDSVMVDGTFDLSSYAAVYSQKVNLKALRNTVEISLLVMLLSVLVTFPLAWLIGRTDLPGRKSSGPSWWPAT